MSNRAKMLCDAADFLIKNSHINNMDVLVEMCINEN